jgi:hypothetical protein
VRALPSQPRHRPWPRLHTLPRRPTRPDPTPRTPPPRAGCDGLHVATPTPTRWPHNQSTGCAAHLPDVARGSAECVTRLRQPRRPPAPQSGATAQRQNPAECQNRRSAAPAQRQNLPGAEPAGRQPAERPNPAKRRSPPGANLPSGRTQRSDGARRATEPAERQNPPTDRTRRATEPRRPSIRGRRSGPAPPPPPAPAAPCGRRGSGRRSRAPSRDRPRCRPGGRGSRGTAPAPTR